MARCRATRACRRAFSAPAGYSWLVKLLPALEESATYNLISGASNKFSFPAFAVIGGSPKAGATTGPGVRYAAGGAGMNTWWRHFSTIDLDQVRCPSFAGDSLAPAGTFPGWDKCSSMYMPVAMNGPTTPWGVVTTNYKAMTATHFGCLQNPNVNPPAFDGINSEAPNGVIVPPVNASSQGTAIRSITDGTSKTIVIAESKEQNYSSWYDGTASWVVAVPIGSLAYIGQSGGLA